jgi:hypothetical protein
VVVVATLRGYARGVRVLWRLVPVFALVAVAVALPLVVVHRSRCPAERSGKIQTEWSLVAPLDEVARDCRRDQTGWEVLREEVGL